MAPLTEPLTLATNPRSLKRKASVAHDDSEDVNDAGAKRAKTEYSVTTPPETPARSERPAHIAPRSVQSRPSPDPNILAEVINKHMGQEILQRHEELRFINLELAKCQTALEQLRRCHLIPYPTACPTPQQMLDIVDGKVPAVQSKAGGSIPQWAPPYGVVDGPYARHYAKWLIPDPKFDGQIPEWQAVSATSATAGEGRSTRNSVPEGATIGKRVARGQTGAKPSAASLPQPPKTKGPIIVERNDGTFVKLVCSFCNPSRDDFNSTQGFLNHCRISHRREFKSHEEAYNQCGQPASVEEIAKIGGEDKGAQGAQSGPPVASTPSAPNAQTAQRPSGVHPLARTDAMAEQNAYNQVLHRIESSLKLFHQGRLPGVSSIPGAPSQTPIAKVDRKPSKSFVGSSATPFLSQLLQSRNFKGSLETHVEDAKAKAVELDELMSCEDDSDEDESTRDQSAPVRVPAMRTLARAVPETSVTEPRPSSSKARSPPLSLVPTSSKLPSTEDSANDEDASSVGDANMMDIDRSPNTATSINAPSLVSDDGGDDSDDASTASDASDEETVSDIAEVNIECTEMQDHIAQHTGSTSTGARMKKDENRHVAFVPTVTGKAAAARRKPRV